jgi:hypothetical protein
MRDQVAYGRAAPLAKEIRWYDGDHFLTSEGLMRCGALPRQAHRYRRR